MLRSAIGKPALLLYAFASLDGTPEAALRGWHRLDELWSAARAAGAMTEPSLGESAPAHLPDLVAAEGEFRVVASARRGAPGRVRSMFAFVENGVAGVIAAISADRDGLEGWTDLADSWADLARFDPDLLGVTAVLVGLSPDPDGVDRVGAAGRRISRAFGGHDNATQAGLGPGGSVVWRCTPTLEPRQVFTLAAPESAEDLVDAWAWAADGRQGLMPFTRYCLNLLRAGHQRRVHRGLRPLARLIADSDDACGLLLRELGRDARRGLDTTALVAADERLRQDQLATSGLVWRVTRILEMAETVRTLRGNARRHHPDEPHGMFAADDAELSRFIDELDREVVLLDAVNRRIEAVHTAASSAITLAIGRRRERLTLLQTSFLGALLMALAAIQSFQYTTPIGAGIKGPLIGALSAAAFALPFLMVRWSGIVTHRDPYRWTDIVAAGFLGGTLGWLAATIAWTVTAERVAPHRITAPAVTLGAAFLAWLTWYLLRRQRRIGRSTGSG
ncbi:CATRA conflict system CASPASE/TPR repeat-associated protein [Actinoplanes sp. NPDC026670]|uniref:CATRA conflict system CASPASE/TPR repeat-associated protein n=1 Tax=Actinoplanes sp. NPDC026670 TaxID=3154700 RepID=UPI00340FEE61